MEQKRGPGRPHKPGGPDPTRSVRVGSVWARAQQQAEERGEKFAAVVTRKLEEYVAGCEGPHCGKTTIEVGETSDQRMRLAVIHLCDERLLGEVFLSPERALAFSYTATELATRLAR